MVSVLCVLLLSLCLASRASFGCVLSGTDSGTCAAIQEQAPFCASSVRYSACVPRELPWLPNLTVAGKDAWVGASVAALVAQREAIERGALVPNDPSLSSFVAPGSSVAARFTARGASGGDCVAAYRNFACFMAFPRCDAAGHVCENFFRACGYSREMRRCYEPAFFGGSKAEGTSGDQLYDGTGNPIFSRAPFPGLPFLDNAFDGDTPLVVCTPSLHNAASTSSASALAAAMALALVAYTARA